MSDKNAQQQIIDTLRDVDNVLVTVNTNPSVDELAAALGFTMLVNKLNKHATAVFSGEIPSAINFLDPEKTFENTVDSLRDFIIALDKEKADHLRYKVEGEMVKIFITPYRTTISDKDLDFSQGDYNVEMVVAIGVKDSNDLDRALADHGKIMHDATVASLSIGSETSDLGTINWHDSQASSYSEMLVSVSEALRTDKNLLDEQISTAFLTGIVAATERFSNDKTSSKVMTMSAQLMAAGANQQLIATKLAEGEREDSKSSVADEQPPSSPRNNPKNTNKKSKKPSDNTDPTKDQQAADGTMSISHEKSGNLDEVSAETARDNQNKATAEANRSLKNHADKSNTSASQTDADSNLAASLANGVEDSRQSAKPSVDDLKKDLQEASKELDEAAKSSSNLPEINLPKPATVADSKQNNPSFGGTLNATTDQAANDKQREIDSDRNKSLLSHGGTDYVGNPPANLPPLNSFNNHPKKEQPGNLETNVNQISGKALDLKPLVDDEAQSLETMKYEAQPHDDARNAIAAALAESPSLEQQKQSIVSTPPTPAPVEPVQTAPQPTPATANDGNGLPPLPPLPDFSTLPPLPGDQSTQSAPSSPESIIDAALPPLPPTPNLPPAPQPSAPAQTPVANDPKQFQIPGSN